MWLIEIIVFFGLTAALICLMRRRTREKMQQRLSFKNRGKEAMA